MSQVSQIVGRPSAWATIGGTARDQASVAIVDMHIETKPAGAGLGGQAAKVDAGASDESSPRGSVGTSRSGPAPVGLFEWAVIGGPGGEGGRGSVR